MDSSDLPSVPTPLIDIESIVAWSRNHAPACDCDECRSTCEGLPGAYDPFHLRDCISDGTIGMTAFKDLVCDFHVGDKNIYYLRPAMCGETPGGLADMILNPRGCSVLTTTGCSLRRSEMPTGCVTSYACEKQRRVRKFEKHEVPEVWNNTVGADLIAQWARINNISAEMFQSRDPRTYVANANIFDTLDGIGSMLDSLMK